MVIAGFGENNTFPSLVAYILEGKVEKRLKYTLGLNHKIDYKKSSSIIPFAQKDMVITFMEGVDPDYRNIETSYLSELFNNYAGIIIDTLNKYNEKEKRALKKKLMSISKARLKDHEKKLEEYRWENYSNPVASVVSMLPKDELAAMAEALVNLTSFKRKVSMESETVGGPIDVAVISKGDGFVWIKRKHYFEKGLNPQFFSKYYKEV